MHFELVATEVSLIGQNFIVVGLRSVGLAMMQLFVDSDGGSFPSHANCNVRQISKHQEFVGACEPEALGLRSKTEYKAVEASLEGVARRRHWYLVDHAADDRAFSRVD